MGRWILFVTLAICWVCSVEAGAESAVGNAVKADSGKKVLWVDSYHAGYPWGDGIGRGIRQALAVSGVELKVWHMDTNRNRSEAYGRQAGRMAKEVIEAYRPDVVIASDDNAQKYLVVPYLKGTDVPVVFCGVNRKPDEYGYPCRNITGMQEVDFAPALARQLRNFSGGQRIGLLDGDTETSRIVADTYRQLLGDQLKVYLVQSFDEYQQAFVNAQQEVDLLLMRNNSGISGWDDVLAESFLVKHTRIPTGSVNRWMKHYVIFNLAKCPEEQGKHAAETALRIIAGERPENIPVIQNREAHLIINLKMAQAAGIVVPVSLLKTAEVIGLEALEIPDERSNSSLNRTSE